MVDPHAEPSDLYEVLGVARHATDEELTEAFRTLAKQFHPDVAGPVGVAADRFAAVANAYDVLSDPSRRAAYDAATSEAARLDSSSLTATPTVARESVAAEPTWSRSRVRVAVIGGCLALLAGVAFAVFTLILQAHERDDRRGRVPRAGIAVAGEPTRRLAFQPLGSDRPIVAVAPDAVTAEPGSVLWIRAPAAGDGDLPHFVTEDTPGALPATLVSSASGPVVVHGMPGTAPAITPDPTPARSAGLHDGESVSLLIDAHDPTDVVVAQSTTARDITFWVVAVKLMLAGPLLIWFAVRLGRRTRATR